MKSRETYLKIFLLLSLLTNLVLATVIYWKIGAFSIATPSQTTTSDIASSFDETEILSEINPDGGYEINAVYGDLGPKMLASGLIDYAKFKQNYERSGQSLTSDLDEILTKGSDQKIRITRSNAYFMLDFFWAVGLGNRSDILTTGAMVQSNGIEGAGNFASTGGWTLARGNAMNYYAKTDLVTLTSSQKGLVQTVAAQIYRPCCDNPTSFPDCNHGMALLGVLEVAAANGATEDQVFQAAKYLNAFWFPDDYSDLASFFRHREGKSFAQVDARTILDKAYSSVSGHRRVRQWLADNGYLQESPAQGGSCGV